MTARLLAVGVSGLLLTTASTAAEWKFRPPAEMLDFPGVDRVLAQEDGYLLAMRSRNLPWVELSLADQIKAQHIVPAILNRPLEDALINLGGGHFAYPVYLDADSGDCRLDVVDTSGRAVLQSRFPADSGNCQFVVEGGRRDSAGGVWLARTNTRQAWRIQADGRAIALPMVDDSARVFDLASAAQSPSAYALYRHSEIDTLARLQEGRLLWSQPIAEGVSMRQVLSLPDDDAMLIGIRIGPDGSGPIVLARYAPDGSLRWQREYSEISSAVSVELRVLSEGRLLFRALESLNGPSRLGTLDAEGELLWSDRISGGEFLRFVDDASSNPQLASPTFAYVLRPPTSGETLPRDRIRLLDSGGELLLDTDVEINSAARSAVLRDGSLVVADFEQAVGVRVRHWTARGVLISNQLAEDLSPFTEFHHLRSALLGDDSLRLSYGQNNLLLLEAVDADGNLKWNADLQPEFTIRNHPSSFSLASESSVPLASNANRVCLGPIRYAQPFFLGAYPTPIAIACYARQDGALAYRYDELPGVVSLYLTRGLHLSAENQVRLIESECGQPCADPKLNLITISADGGEVAKRVLQFPGLTNTYRQPYGYEGDNVLPVFAADGSFVILLGAAGGALQWASFDRNGQLIASQNFAVPAQNLLRAQAIGPDKLVLHSLQGERHRLLGLEGQQIRWQREWYAPLALGSQQSSEGFIPALRFVTADNHILLLEQRVEEGRTVAVTSLLDASSGAPLWQVDASLPEGMGVRSLALDVAAGHALISSDRPGGSVLELRSLADGRLLGARSLDCPGSQGCAIESTWVADDGSLRVIDQSAWLARYELDDSIEPARTGQPALAGTWYEPGSNGQGLLVDYNASQGQLLGAWFTYAEADLFDASGLRWFTLQGSLAANAGRAELEIYRNRYGAFDDQPVTPAERVGSAELQLRNCSQLILSYRFDDGELAGQRGTVPLTRLSPNVFDCENADGSVVSAQPASPAASSFQAGQTGAWYTPATSGQGLLFDIRPPSADGSDPGVLLGGWFTYDVEGLEDDETAQHWFLLQGDLAGADSNGAQVPIYRSTGGRFDQRATSNIHRVGIATVRLNGCTSGELSYQFDDSDVAGEFRLRQGQMGLIKLLGCAE
ncbi:hypothetical protein [Pseudomarimonas arenosa]|uniref:Uncharacterized protein n=1 Tax=Pseudomarimonas arenosa TaxID=2774145 RepID=A0AAW3ZKB0_9GAMM|nr:hypothetical protein [Pseudomarimonas arenosa]MBD8525639.1 hypothetical protein [Pseudomarimonas arenosa]